MKTSKYPSPISRPADSIELFAGMLTRASCVAQAAALVGAWSEPPTPKAATEAPDGGTSQFAVDALKMVSRRDRREQKRERMMGRFDLERSVTKTRGLLRYHARYENHWTQSTKSFPSAIFDVDTDIETHAHANFPHMLFEPSSRPLQPVLTARIADRTINRVRCNCWRELKWKSRVLLLVGCKNRMRLFLRHNRL